MRNRPNMADIMKRTKQVLHRPKQGSEFEFDSPGDEPTIKMLATNSRDDIKDNADYCLKRAQTAWNFKWGEKGRLGEAERRRGIILVLISLIGQSISY